MPLITICTFNVENLFGRYKVFGYLPGDKYKKRLLMPEELEDKGGFLPGQVYAPKNSFQIFDKDEWRDLTAKALKGNTENYPDIACLQEIENLRVLRRFNDDYLGKVYPYALLIDGHDPRLIDIGVLSKRKITDVRTYIDEPYDDRPGYLFSRDCLEVTFDIDGAPLTLFVNHLKSKYSEGAKQKEEADKKRNAQARKVVKIVKERFKEKGFSNRAFAVVGDFNDTPDSEPLKPLVQGLGLENVLERVSDKTKRWTHWWRSKNTISQIDYILLSPKLAKDSSIEPYIERRGISSAKKYSHLATPDDKKGEKIAFQSERFPEVTDEIEASDHCPVFFTLKL